MEAKVRPSCARNRLHQKEITAGVRRQNGGRAAEQEATGEKGILTLNSSTGSKKAPKMYLFISFFLNV